MGAYVKMAVVSIVVLALVYRVTAIRTVVIGQ
jgi:hypothetical protein